MEPYKPYSSPAANRRQRQIEDCLFENMQRTPYASISVADLCRQVGISRKAFYNYYHDKDECLCSYIDRLIRDAMLYTTTTVSDTATKLEVATVLLECWKQHRAFWDTIIRNDLLHLVMLESQRYILEEDKLVMELLNTPDVQTDTDILACYISIQITLVLQWYLRDFDTPTEEMAKKLVRLIHAPFMQVPEK